MLQSLVVPALPTLQHDLHTTPTGVTWIFTAYLLAASVATPIAGRLGDMFGKKRMLVLVLAGLGAGTLLAALATTLPLMIGARAVQGLGGAIFPLAFGIVRDEFPRERVAGGIALISGLLGVGGGLGIVLAGPILSHFDYHWLFWIPLVAIVLSVVATLLVVPESPLRAPGYVNWTAAALLALWLISLLVAISEAPTWGWLSGRTLGLLVAAAVLAVAWIRAESRSASPLVDMTMMRLRGVWTTNLAGLLLGFGMYSAFVLIPQFVQTPSSNGYGFGSSVTQAGLFLIPSTFALMLASPIGGRLSDRFGSKVPLVLGPTTTMFAFVLLALAHTAHWQIYLASLLLGTGIGFAFASMANLIVEAVRADQTGVATGMNTVMRTIGGAVGGQVAASILAASLLADGCRQSTGTPCVCRSWPSRSHRDPRLHRRSRDSPTGPRLSTRRTAVPVEMSADPPRDRRRSRRLSRRRRSARLRRRRGPLRGLPLRVVCAWQTAGLGVRRRGIRGHARRPVAAEHHAEDVLRTALERLTVDDVRVEALSIEGHPAAVLVDQAADAELLVLGSRGHGAASGSSRIRQQDLAHHTPCPLVIVPSTRPELTPPRHSPEVRFVRRRRAASGRRTRPAISLAGYMRLKHSLVIARPAHEVFAVPVRRGQPPTLAVGSRGGDEGIGCAGPGSPPRRDPERAGPPDRPDARGDGVRARGTA